MKILFYRYGNICEPDIIEQFVSFGLEVETEVAEVTNKKLTASEQVSLVDHHLKNNQFLFVFTINFFPAISDLCEIYKIPYVCWTVDSPVVELFSKSITNSVNHIFVFDRKQYETLSQYIKGVYPMPLATNVSRWDKLDLRDDANGRFTGDIAFVGSLYTDNSPLKGIKLSDYTQGFLDGLYKTSSKLEGFSLIERSLSKDVTDELKKAVPHFFDGFENTFIPTENYIASASVVGMHFSSKARIDCLRALGNKFNVNLYTRSDSSLLKDVKGISLKGGVDTLTEMPKVFRNSKINLNMTIYPIEKGLPLRIWDILGAGGFLLTNYREELTDYLEPGVDCDFYSDIDELVDKCGFYLEHDDLRRRIAANGYEKVKNYHTYTNRMADMFKTILG